MTLGEFSDTIIAKEFSSNPFPHRPQFLPYQDSIATTDQWKYRRMVSKEEPNKNQMGRVTPDERQIIRMAQPPSPRKSGMYHEPVSPSEGHFIQADRRALPPHSQSSSVPSGGEFQLDRYMSNKIVEAMRTSDEKSRTDDRDNMGGNERQSHMQPSSHNKDLDRSSTPGEMIIDEERSNVDPHHHHPHQHPQSQHNASHPYSQQPIPQQQPPPQQTVTTFATTTYAYPYSALNVGASATAAVLAQSGPPNMKLSNPNSDTDPQQRPTQTLAAEPKPLLSAQYEALSDED